MTPAHRDTAAGTATGAKRHMMTYKILFLHGFFASGSCVPAQALRQSLSGKATVLSPDLPLHPGEALQLVMHLCQTEKPSILVGNSNGAFLAQIIASRLGLPALLGNPHFEMSQFVAGHIGIHHYKSPRTDGRQEMVIDRRLADEFADLQKHQWDACNPAHRDRVWGLFGSRDDIAHYEPVFLQHYTHSYHFPGAHTPTADEVRQWYAPLALRLATTHGATI